MTEPKGAKSSENLSKTDIEMKTRNEMYAILLESNKYLIERK